MPRFRVQPKETMAAAAMVGNTTAGPLSAPVEKKAPKKPSSSWKPLLPMSTPRAAAGGLCINDQQFLAIGGQSGPREYLNTCEYYDTQSELWMRLPNCTNLPTTLAFFGIAKVGNTIYCVGGKEASALFTTKSEMHALDLSECFGDRSLMETASFDQMVSECRGDLSRLKKATWKPMAPMSERRHRFACVAHKHCIYVFGGKNEKGDRLATAEKYDTQTNTWSSLPNLPCGENNGCAAAVVGSKIYLVGGMGQDGTMLAGTMVYDTLKQQWESPCMVPNMKNTRWGLLLANIEHYLIAIGGDFDKTIEVLDTRKNEWNFAPLPMKHDKSVCMVGTWKTRGEILVAGGLIGIKATRAVETIGFRSGLFPDSIRFEKWKQKEIGSKEAEIARKLASQYKGFSKRKRPSGGKCGCAPKPGRSGACCPKPK